MERKKWLHFIAEEIGTFLFGLVGLFLVNNLPQPQTTVWIARDTIMFWMTVLFIAAIICVMLIVAIYYLTSESKQEVV
jgi:hypothetical protein